VSIKEAWESHKEAARDAAVTEVRSKFMESEKRHDAKDKRISELEKQIEQLKVMIGALTERMDKMSEWAKGLKK
jgi:septal ring factor EnvC (AmiA/AmiB activator)